MFIEKEVNCAILRLFKNLTDNKDIGWKLLIVRGLLFFELA